MIRFSTRCVPTNYDIYIYIIPVTTPSECGSVRSVSRRARHRRRRRKAPCRDVDHVCLSRPMSLLELPTDLLRRSASVAWPVRSMFAYGGDARLQYHAYDVRLGEEVIIMIQCTPRWIAIVKAPRDSCRPSHRSHSNPTLASVPKPSCSGTTRS